MALKKKYQVFVSSTFKDLPEERQAVFQTLLKMDCIPAGMEFFGANDEEQMTYIRKVIEASDYYLVIVAGRYGSTTEAGISYTEKEFDCALELKIPVIALLHKNPDAIPKGKSEPDPGLQEKLGNFRKRLEDKRLADYWENVDQLRASTALAMVNARDNRPMPGWVRGDAIANTETLAEIHELRKKLEEAEAKVPARSTLPVIDDLADLDELFTVTGVYGPLKEGWSGNVTWRTIAKAALSGLLVPQWDETIRQRLSRQLFPPKVASPYETLNPNEVHLDEGVFDAIRMQLSALGLVRIGRSPNTPAGAAGLAWEATDSGKALNYLSTVVRTKKKKKG